MSLLPFSKTKQKPLNVDLVLFSFFVKASPRCASLALKHYLLKPVQRIPQYQLLLTGKPVNKESLK